MSEHAILIAFADGTRLYCSHAAVSDREITPVGGSPWKWLPAVIGDGA